MVLVVQNASALILLRFASAFCHLFECRVNNSLLEDAGALRAVPSGKNLGANLSKDFRGRALDIGLLHIFCIFFYAIKTYLKTASSMIKNRSRQKQHGL
jgi:hypothetical protein